MRRILISTVFVPLAACAGAMRACPPGTMAAQQFELFFGGSPDPAAWNAFRDSEIAPRFPEGFTVLDASGQWRGRDGRMLSESSKELLLIGPDTADSAAKIVAIRDAYKSRFRQESVLLAEAPVCAGF
jgi:hypothetical protein